MLYSNSLAKHKDPKAIETTKIKKLEQGWAIPPCREIPKYSVENDKYCPLAITKHYNSIQKTKVKSSNASEEDTAQWIRSNISNKFEAVPEKLTPAIIHGSEFPPLPSDIPDASILHKIIVRENLIGEIKKLLEHNNDIDGARNEINELVKAIRYESVDIVDDIKEWRANQKFSRQFLYRGENYLAKMYSDLDFLDNVDELDFGFPMTGNPLAFAFFGGRQLPDNLRFSMDSAVESTSGFVSKHVRMADEILIDGIEVSRLHQCDKFIRDEALIPWSKAEANNNIQSGQSVLAVGENGMNDSYLSASKSAMRAPNGHMVSFQGSIDGQLSRKQESSYNVLGQSSVVSMPAAQMSATTSGFVAENVSSVVSGTRSAIQLDAGSSAGPQRQMRADKGGSRVNIKTSISPPKKSTHSAPNAKWIAKTKETNIIKERIATLMEEIEVIKAMHAHVADQIDFKMHEQDRLTEIRRGLDSKRLVAISQSKPIKAQEIAIRVNIADAELQEIYFAIKDLQRQSFFFEQELKRKKMTAARQQKEIETITRNAAIQKKLEKRVAKEGLLAVLKAHNSGQGDMLEDPSIFREGSAVYTEEGQRLGSPGDQGGDEYVGPEITAPNGSIAENSISLQLSAEGSEILDPGAAAYREPLRDVSAMDSTFSAAVEPNAMYKFLPNNSSIAIEEERSLNSDDASSTGPNILPPAAFSEEGPAEGIETASGREVPAGSAYSFVKSTKETKESKEKENSVSDEMKTSPLSRKNSESSDLIQDKNKTYACLVRNQKLNIRMLETSGNIKLFVSDTEGVYVGDYPIVAALAKQLKDLDEDSIKSALSDIVSNFINPDSPSITGVSNQISHTVMKQRPKYQSLINGIEFESELIEKGPNELQIRSRNLLTGDVKLIPLLPILAVQVPNLDDLQINGIITDILKSTIISY